MYLEIESLTKKYKDFIALNSFSYKFEPKIYALLGPNGAGKSTLINSIVGLSKINSGSIILRDDQNNILNINKCLGFLPQSIEFYNNYTPDEMLRYIATLKKYTITSDEITELLKEVNLSEVRYKQIGHFSKGMKQKLGVAQSFIGYPQVLIFDEPTAGLDPKERIRFKNLLSHYGSKIITIIATHIISDIENIAHEILIIKDGALITYGTQNYLEQTINDYVWELKTTEDEINNISDALLVSKCFSREQDYFVRVISKNRPGKNFKNVSPDLEDVYLFYTECV